MSDRVQVERSVPCDFCPNGERLARYDGKTTQGPWAYMCAEHWKTFGVGRLGTGYGQELVPYTCVHCGGRIERAAGETEWFHAHPVVGDVDPSRWHVPEPAGPPSEGAV